MGMNARKLRSEKRKMRKRAAKAAKKALYQSYAGTGRRKKKKSCPTGATSQKGNHVMTDCGNIGCKACYPQFRVLQANMNPTRKAG